jgi:hypothetical protein
VALVEGQQPDPALRAQTLALAARVRATSGSAHGWAYAEQWIGKARTLAPDQPSVMYAQAELELARDGAGSDAGAQAEAARWFERAAAAWLQDGDPRAATRAAVRSAELQRGLGQLRGAELELEWLLDRVGDAPQALLALARVQRASGARAAAATYARLLHGTPPDAAGDVWAEAARFHLDECGDPDAAAPFVERLRACAEHPELEALDAEVRRGRADRVLADPERMAQLDRDTLLRSVQHTSTPGDVWRDLLHGAQASDPETAVEAAVVAARRAGELDRLAAELVRRGRVPADPQLRSELGRAAADEDTRRALDPGAQGGDG